MYTKKYLHKLKCAIIEILNIINLTKKSKNRITIIKIFFVDIINQDVKNNIIIH